MIKLLFLNTAVYTGSQAGHMYQKNPFSLSIHCLLSRNSASFTPGMETHLETHQSVFLIYFKFLTKEQHVAKMKILLKILKFYFHVSIS